MIAIAGVGLCTAQGSARDVIRGGAPQLPELLPWPRGRAACGIGFVARGIDRTLRGPERWRALAEAALDDLGGSRDVPVIAATCNGGADAASAEDWAGAFAALGVAGPIASAACASGLHALWLGAIRIADGCDELIVLAVDILAAVNHDQFESLRILAESPAPWQPSATGFVPGEAAVAIRLVRARDGDGLPRLRGPRVAHDREGVDALAELVAEFVGRQRSDARALESTRPGDARELASVVGNGIGAGELAVASVAGSGIGPVDARELVVASVLGQGTGPVAVDARELAALAPLPLAIPLATPLAAFGHAIGASGLLAVALAILGRERTLAALAMRHATATDGRALGTARGDALVICRALGGACAVTAIGEGPIRPQSTSGAHATVHPPECAPPISRWNGIADGLAPPPALWSVRGELPALRTPLLRRIAEALHARRPATPPAAIIVALDAPIVPPPDARIGGRLLPSAVLEMTPGFLPQLVARLWGFAGPALCLVGSSDADMVAACRRVHGTTLVLHVRADGFEWEA